ncbi:nucleotide-binding-oligomerization-domain like receptor [Pyrrhoderma noxium]|uniref:Nucleotide-binding-oligomerization-domain like receptor n=1 Tax=Pyrrhoderma noxium TaxID=2282107 RepID=A0A286UCN8_9AGAM|nr:nucleotide-binding-oligomerization-domain like receptor [Pyrrhoderma noxium]
MSFHQSGPNASAKVDSFNDVGRDQNNINGNNNTINYMEREDTYENVIKRLKDTLNPSHIPGDGRPECLENTRVQTLKDIDGWIYGMGSPNILLLTGGAGTGKSTIATTVAETRRRSGHPACHLFFLRGKSDPSTVIRTISYNLAVSYPPIARLIHEEVKRSGELSSATLESEFDILLRKPLSSISSEINHPILVVLDAIDECGTPQSRRVLMDVLSNGIPSLHPAFRFLITGRPEEDIIPFASLSNVRHITLDQLSEESMHDVPAYIEYELGKLMSSNMLKVPSDWPWDKSLQTLSESANGLFIWASTAVKFVQEGRLNRLKRLEQLVNNARSLDLNDLYITVLKNALQWDDYESSVFKDVFSLILFSKSPLSIQDITGILGLQEDTASTLLSYLRSLVAYEECQPIKIYHTSFYDYLVSCVGQPWYIDIEAQKISIVNNCFGRMEELLRYDICGLEMSLKFNKDVPDLDERIAKNIPSFLKYICCNWFYHIRDVPYSLELCEQLKSFASDRLLFWFEVLSLTETFNNQVVIALLNTTQWVGDNDKELLIFLRDAYRQASVFSDPISESTPHIYTSFLRVAIEDSIVAKHYSRYAHKGYWIEYIGEKLHSDCIKVVDSHYGRVTSVSFSSDGTRVVCGYLDGTVCIFDSASWRMIVGPLEGHENYVSSVIFSPDGRYIVSGSWDCTIIKWDSISGDLIWQSSELHTNWVTSVVFSPDGNSIASGSYDCTIHLWNPESGEQAGDPMQGHTGIVYSIAFSPDSLYLVSGSGDHTVTVWDVTSRKMKLGLFEEHEGEVNAVEFSPGGDIIVSGSYDGTIRIWDAITGEVKRVIKTGDGWGRFGIKIWDTIDSTAAPKKFSEHSNIKYVSFAPNGISFVSLSKVCEIRVWDALGGGETTTPVYERESISTIAVSPSGLLIASGTSNGSVRLWNALTGELIPGPWDEDSERVYSVSFSPDERFIASGSCDNTVKLWNISNGDCTTFQGHTDDVTSVAFSSSNPHIASGSYDESIRIWNIDSGEIVVEPLTGHTSRVTSVCYSPDGTKIVSGSSDETVRIWNSETGQLISTLTGHSDTVNSVAYSSDGSRIVSGSDDDTIIVWDAESGQVVCGPISGHSHWVNSVCFSPDGNRVISGSNDRSVRIWDASTGNLCRIFEAHMDYVNSVCFFPDGIHFASGSNDGTIRIWTLEDDANDVIWHLRHEDGWVVSENGELIMWIPPDLRSHLCIMNNTRILNLPFHMKLHFITL